MMPPPLPPLKNANNDWQSLAKSSGNRMQLSEVPSGSEGGVLSFNSADALVTMSKVDGLRC